MTVNINFLQALQVSTSTSNIKSKANDYTRDKGSDFRSELNQAASERKADNQFANRINSSYKQNSTNKFQRLAKESRADNNEKIHENDSGIKAKARENIEESSHTEQKPIDTEKPEINELDAVKNLKSLKELLELLELLANTELPGTQNLNGKTVSIESIPNISDSADTVGKTMEKLQAIISEAETKLAKLPEVERKEAKEVIGELKQLFEAVKQDVKNTNTVAYAAKINSTDNASLLTKLNEKLNELTKIVQSMAEKTGQKLIDENPERFEEIAKVLEAAGVKIKSEPKVMFDSQKHRVYQSEVNEDTTVKVNNEAETQNIKVKETELKNNAQSDDKIVVEEKQGREIKTDSSSTKQNDSFAVKLDSILKQNDIKTNSAENVERAAEIPKTEIVKQIVRKAEVILKDGKSEMNMKLEPEHLGKLMLKIVVEKGQVEAKFVAESYKVKEAIEANFNQLKDMLQDKGISVQSFSVSVGQEGREFNNNNNMNIWKEAIRDNSKRTSAGSYAEYEVEDVKTGANPYSYHEGKIDFKA
ncbi:MAG: flagellar hook-length control protein FliK [Bacillota bacterium]